ncbi:MAG: IPT/TIG domain-containing protein, partial [Actinomycetota bacterium]|nr:IPT/TIG domain-containing protein [Actinomycetota bacterium]
MSGKDRRLLGWGRGFRRTGAGLLVVVALSSVQQGTPASAAAGDITTVAGIGPAFHPFSGDGGPATVAPLNTFDVAADRSGNLYVADLYNNRVRKIDAAGMLSTYAGNGSQGFSGDGGPATAAGLDGGPLSPFQYDGPIGLGVDTAGDLFIASYFRVRRVDARTHVITTVAGDGTPGSGGDNGPGPSAEIDGAPGLAVDGAGNVYLPDAAKSRVRRVDAITHIITTVAGSGAAGFSGDGGPAKLAAVTPARLAVDNAGNLFISGAGRVRKVSAATGIITTVAGDGIRGSTGDGGMATAAAIGLNNAYADIATDVMGNLFIVDQYSMCVRKVDAVSGIITTVASVSGPYNHSGYSGDGGPATSAGLDDPLGLALNPAGDLFIADSGRIRKVEAAALPPTVTAVTPASGPGTGGTMVTITGTGFATAPGVTKVRFRDLLATSVSCSSPTSCTAISPAGTGSAHVTVTVAGQSSPMVMGD